MALYPCGSKNIVQLASQNNLTTANIYLNKNYTDFDFIAIRIKVNDNNTVRYTSHLIPVAFIPTAASEYIYLPALQYYQNGETELNTRPFGGTSVYLRASTSNQLEVSTHNSDPQQCVGKYFVSVTNITILGIRL